MKATVETARVPLGFYIVEISPTEYTVHGNAFGDKISLAYNLILVA